MYIGINDGGKNCPMPPAMIILLEC